MGKHGGKAGRHLSEVAVTCLQGKPDDGSALADAPRAPYHLVREGECEPMNPIPLGKYRHYKGNEYKALGFAKHSETLEDMVVYKALYGEGGVWARPLSMWENPIEVGGTVVKRFEYISEKDDSSRQHELREALRAIHSTISKCEKAFAKFAEGTSQHTLMKRRLAAFYIAVELIEKELETLHE